MYEDKTLITIDDIIRVSELSRKITRCVFIIIWTIMILGGLKYKAIIAWTIIAAVLSLFVLLVDLYNSTKVRCINNKRLEAMCKLVSSKVNESETMVADIKKSAIENIINRMVLLKSNDH